MSVLVPIPPNDAPLLIAQRIAANEKPAILPILAAQPHFHLVGQAPGNQPLAFSQGAFHVVGMNEHRQMVRRGILGAQAVIFARHLIGIDPAAIRIQDKDMLRDNID